MLNETITTCNCPNCGGAVKHTDEKCEWCLSPFKIEYNWELEESFEKFWINCQKGIVISNPISHANIISIL